MSDRRILGPEDVSQADIKAIDRLCEMLDATFERLKIPINLKIDLTLTLALSYLCDLHEDTETREPALLTLRRLRDQVTAMSSVKTPDEMEQVMTLFAAGPVSKA